MKGVVDVKYLKTLIKMELRSVCIMIIYFLGIGIGCTMKINQQIHDIIKRTYSYGLTGFLWETNEIKGWKYIFTESIHIYIGLSLVGLLLMVYLSYRNDKNHEIGRFLKSLPYTMKERYLVKVGVGLSIFTTLYILHGIMLVIFRESFLEKTKDIFEVTIFSEIYQELFSSSQLIQTLLVVYVALVACYLFMIMFQYLVSPNFASLIVGVLVGLSPGFILWNLYIYLNPWVKGELLYTLADFYSVFIWGDGNWGSIEIKGMELVPTSSISYLDFIGMRIAIFLAIAALCFICTLKWCQKSQLEKADLFIPGNIFRGIFVLGATLCSGMLLGDLYYIYYRARNWMMYGLGIVGLVLGSIIVWKIAHIGIKKSDAKKAKEVQL